jgi:hypothetical protein
MYIKPKSSTGYKYKNIVKPLLIEKNIVKFKIGKGLEIIEFSDLDTFLKN